MTMKSSAVHEPLISPVPLSAIVQQRSPWHSPVPYLFGGLAAMLGLIAFPLLILACSYWKPSSHGRRHDVEAGDGDDDDDEKPENMVKVMPVVGLDEKIVVIMAGDVRPTFLTTPMFVSSSRSADHNYSQLSFRSENNEKNCEEEGTADIVIDKSIQEISDQR